MVPPALIAAIVGAGVQAGAGIFNVVSGAVTTAKANREAKVLDATRPQYNIPSNYYDNLNLATSRAQRGFSDETMGYLSNQLERGLSASNNAILRGGGNVNNIGNAYDTFAQQTRAIGFEDEKLRTANITQLIAQNQEMAKEKSQQWAMNVWSKWADKAAAVAQMKSIGQQRLNAGISGIASAGVNAGKILGAPSTPQVPETPQTPQMPASTTTAVSDGSTIIPYQIGYNPNNTNSNTQFSFKPIFG
jgi:hypothetical protein